jgi:hypothetical protein
MGTEWTESGSDTREAVSGTTCCLTVPYPNSRELGGRKAANTSWLSDRVQKVKGGWVETAGIDGKEWREGEGMGGASTAPTNWLIVETNEVKEEREEDERRAAGGKLIMGEAPPPPLTFTATRSRWRGAEENEEGKITE